MAIDNTGHPPTPEAERLAKIEATVEQISHRLSELNNHMNNRLSDFSGSINANREEISRLRDETSRLRAESNTQFRWLVGIVIATWTPVMLALLGLYLKGTT